jgi:hypothetical protein
MTDIVEPEMTKTAHFPRILYIMGFGRGGSTILEVLLANNPGVFGSGELTHVFTDAVLLNVACSCGAASSDCAIWSKVWKRLNWTEETARANVRLLRRVEHHARFHLVAAGLVDRATLDSYARINSELFEAISEVTGAEVVIDSSKYAGRALALHRAFLGRVQVICLTRSPRGLMRSFEKPQRDEQFQKSALGACLYYTYVLSCLHIAAKQLGKDTLRVCYEDLASNPESVIYRIGQWWRRDVSQTLAKLQTHEMFDVGHVVTGNRLRYHGRLQFNPEVVDPYFCEPMRRYAIRLMEAYEKIWRAGATG